MIESIDIKNFKSVVDLKLELGNFNVLIGENGCGKTNILEAIAFGAAASADKLDFEFLGSRGIRVTNPEFMFSAFNEINEEEKIEIIYMDKNQTMPMVIKYDSENPRKWNRFFLSKKRLIKSDDYKNAIKQELLEKIDIFSFDEDELTIFESVIKNFKETLYKDFPSIITLENINTFIIYSLEESRLRKFEDTNQIYPLGIKGEGLFQYIKELIVNEKNHAIIDEIKENLALLDWYEDFKIPDNLMSNEFSLKIKDKYLNENLQFFDQRSTNEGFLYLLFYITLFISKDTPSFFAIDNIDASFNPKLCRQLTKNLALLAKKHNKQVIVTTHNPAILDGLNLQDDAQRLFVVRRNDDGHTKINRIEHKSERKMKLSEIWTNGFIGGLPENF